MPSDFTFAFRDSFNETFAATDAKRDALGAKMARYGLSKLYNHLHVSHMV